MIVSTQTVVPLSSPASTSGVVEQTGSSRLRQLRDPRNRTVREPHRHRQRFLRRHSGFCQLFLIREFYEANESSSTCNSGIVSAIETNTRPHFKEHLPRLPEKENAASGTSTRGVFGIESLWEDVVSHLSCERGENTKACGDGKKFLRYSGNVIVTTVCSASPFCAFLWQTSMVILSGSSPRMMPAYRRASRVHLALMLSGSRSRVRTLSKRR